MKEDEQKQENRHEYWIGPKNWVDRFFLLLWCREELDTRSGMVGVQEGKGMMCTSFIPQHKSIFQDFPPIKTIIFENRAVLQNCWKHNLNHDRPEGRLNYPVTTWHLFLLLALFRRHFVHFWYFSSTISDLPLFQRIYFVQLNLVTFSFLWSYSYILKLVVFFSLLNSDVKYTVLLILFVICRVSNKAYSVFYRYNIVFNVING